MGIQRSLFAGIAVGLLLGSGPAFPQPALPGFKSLLIERAGSFDEGALALGQMPVGMRFSAGTLRIVNLSLADLIRIAYRLQPGGISGPDWIATERFNIAGETTDDSSPGQAPEMLKLLLATRFNLKAHRQMEERPAYVLLQESGGARLTRAAAADPASPTGPNQARIRPGSSGGLLIAGTPGGSTRLLPGPGNTAQIEASHMPMSAFAELLARLVNRPVVDQTGLIGAYQVTLNLSTDDLRKMETVAGLATPQGVHRDSMTTKSEPNPFALSILASLQHLGLKLEERRVPIEVLVIDQLDRVPTAP